MTVVRCSHGEARQRQCEEQARLAAVDQTAGILGDAPDWREWLRQVRGGTADDRLRDLGWPPAR